MDFPSHGSQLSLAFLLSKSVVNGRGMCLNNGYSRTLIISGFILFCCCVLVKIFLIAFLRLKCRLEDKLR